MTKLILLLLALFTQVSLLNAQTQFSVKGGTSLTAKTTTKEAQKRYEVKPGYYLGVNADVPLVKRLYLRPGIELVQKRVNEFYYGIGHYNKSLVYMDVPLNLVYKLPLAKNSGICIGVGPYVGFGVSGKIEQINVATGQATYKEKLTFGKEGDYKTYDGGGDAMLAVYYKKVALNFQYRYGFTTINVRDENSYVASQSNQYCLLSLSYFFK